MNICNFVLFFFEFTVILKSNWKEYDQQKNAKKHIKSEFNRGKKEIRKSVQTCICKSVFLNHKSINVWYMKIYA